ncbi:hypothetical protein AWW66_23630 [Micromonospora rosaria]|uniref:Uncharacterized protein n=1 Tax=Micromonospora rosaria TaxID=47874 RepID=A0A136PM38_9ACTN|nr:hypothetical protein [Micromonospora rosaria]KXK59535.1 hypothetical protein AWW66_23630 [Micromonospora rosaria]
MNQAETDGPARTSRTLLLLLAAGPVFELPGASIAVGSFVEVADHAVFGAAGSQLVLTAALVTAVLTVSALWGESRTSAGFRRVVGSCSGVAAGLMAVLAMGFVVDAQWAVVAVLLAHCAVSLGVLGGLALRSAAGVAPLSVRTVSSR